MKTENVYAIVGLIVMGFALIFFNTKSDDFLRIFGVGVGIMLVGAITHALNGIIYLIKKK